MLGTTAWDMSTVVSSKPHLHTMLQQWLVKVPFHILFDEYKLISLEVLEEVSYSTPVILVFVPLAC